MSGHSFDAGRTPLISQGNYYMPGFDSDYEERMLFRYRDGLKEQLKTLQEDEDSPYRERMKDIEKNLNTLILFTERQIYEKQVLKDKMREQRKEAYMRAANPAEAARMEERKNFRHIASLNRQLTIMERLAASAKTNTKATDSAKYDMLRRAFEISVEIKHMMY
ncbi:MAG: hypothetical protein FWH01_03765 [Oscillospiraceae bacterium]|nr:hypothetical protein [Oscillospiraceae bacterium]